jgi:hypothetical protein
MSTLPSDFFTTASFATLAGCVAITVVVTGALELRFGWKKMNTGFVVSPIVVFASLLLADKLSDVKADVIGLANSFLVYLTAAGASGATGALIHGKPMRGDKARTFFGSWFS